MNPRSFEVHLRSVAVGWLEENSEGRIGFRFSDRYRESVERPVLSQSFQDDLERTYWGSRPGQLPTFFANLLPEGRLRSLLEASLELPEDDALGLLAAVGHDLPGAVSLHASSAVPEHVENGPPYDTNGGNGDEPTDGLRFSLAGVQLKFSMNRSDERRFSLPAHNLKGDWIVKVGSPEYPSLAENEYAMMLWARLSSFDVPECHLLEPDRVASIRKYLPDESRVLAVRRYDRAENGVYHQEDFAQLVGTRKKYDGSYDQLSVVVGSLLGEDAFFEFLRRLALTVAIGNSDAHLKNWSLLYRDAQTPALAPLYDQVSTIAWPKVSSDIALKFAGSRDFGRVSADSFRRVAKKAKADPEDAAKIASDTVASLRVGWQMVLDEDVLPPDHVEAILSHWKRVPLLRDAGDLS